MFNTFSVKEHVDFIRKALKLSVVPIEFDPSVVEVAEAAGVGASTLIEFRPLTLSAVTWCLMALQNFDLSHEERTEFAKMVKRMIDLCSKGHGEEDLQYALHPKEPETVLGFFNVLILNVALKHFANVPSPALRIPDRFQFINLCKPVNLDGLGSSAFVCSSPSSPLPIEDEIRDVRYTYTAIIANFLAKGVGNKTMFESTTSVQPQTNQNNTSWRWPGAWKLVCSAAQRLAVLKFLSACQDKDTGGFAGYPGGEAHGGYTYCAVCAISILEGWPPSEDYSINRELLMWWLKERCLTNGLFGGRPGKSGDVCYSFWISAAWTAMGFNLATLPFPELKIPAILSCCHPAGGLSKTPLTCSAPPFLQDHTSCIPDPFHTSFGLLALNLFTQHQLAGYELVSSLLTPIDPFFTLPTTAVNRIMSICLS